MSTKDFDGVALDPRRYRGLMICSIPLLVSALLLNVILQLTVGPLQSPDKWYQLDPSLLDMVGGKSQIVELGYSERPDPLVVTLGSSSMRLGLDSERAEQLSGVPWLNLGVLGASHVTIRNLLRPFLRSGLHPDVLVVGFHSCWLGRDRDFRENKDTYRPDGWSWLSRNRQPLSDGFARDLLLLRAQWGIFRWPSEIWQTRQKFFSTVTPEFLQWQLQQVTARGYFTAKNYLQRPNDEAIALVGLLTDLKSLGLDRVVLVDMPVHSAIRGRTPAVAKELVARCLETVGMSQWEFYDLRDAVPDSGFVDYFHQNHEGGLQLTEALAKVVFQRKRAGQRTSP